MLKFFIGFYVIVGLFFGCSGSLENSTLLPAENQKKQDSQGQFMNTVSEVLINPHMNSLVEQSVAIEEEISETCRGDKKEFQLKTLQDLWSQAMYDYHYLEALVYAPLTIFPKENFTTSELDTLYSKPKQDPTSGLRMQIRLASVQQVNYGKGTQSVPSWALGLDALEGVFFKLFVEADSLGADDGTCYFLTHVTKDMVNRVGDYQKGWLEERAYLQSPEGKVKLKEKINQLAQYVIKFTDQKLKAARLSAPLGLLKEQYKCLEKEECIEKYVEHPFYENPKIALQASAQALNDLFQAGKTKRLNKGTVGFDDYIKKINPTSVLLNPGEFNQLLSKIENLPKADDYRTAFLVSDEKNTGTPIGNILENVNTVTQWLKTDFVSNLQAELPKAVQGDND